MRQANIQPTLPPANYSTIPLLAANTYDYNRVKKRRGGASATVVSQEGSRSVTMLPIGWYRSECRVARAVRRVHKQCPIQQQTLHNNNSIC